MEVSIKVHLCGVDWWAGELISGMRGLIPQKNYKSFCYSSALVPIVLDENFTIYGTTKQITLWLMNNDTRFQYRRKWGVNNKITFSNVEIEEITVQHRLHNSSNDGNELVMIFNHIAVHLNTKVDIMNKIIFKNNTKLDIPFHSLICLVD